jgi:hypothetical protein
MYFLFTVNATPLRNVLTYYYEAPAAFYSQLQLSLILEFLTIGVIVPQPESPANH